MNPDTILEKTLAPYHFTERELADLGKRLSVSHSEGTRLQGELDSIKADYKGKLATVEHEQATLCRKIGDGYEMRETQAVVTFNDPTKGRKTYRYEDSGEFIREEAMTFADQERPLPLTDSTPVEPSEHESPSGEVDSVPDGGALPFSECATDLGAKLLEAAAGADVPLLVPSASYLKAIEPNGGERSNSRIWTEFRKMAKTQGWPEPCINLLKEWTKGSDGPVQLIETLSAHVIQRPAEKPTEQPAESSTEPTES